MRLVARVLVALAVAACHREAPPVHVGNSVPAAVDARPDVAPEDPRFAQCDSYLSAVARASECAALDPAIKQQIAKTADELGPSITERYMDGGDGFTVNRQCDDERENIERLAKTPCGW